MQTYPGTRVSVIVSNPEAERAGEAGVTIRQVDAETASVLFDSDNQQADVKLADLRAL